MPQVAADIVALIYKLLPGFIAAWVFYSLTAYRRKGPFERTVQALIFATLIQVVVIAIRESLVLLGRFTVALGTWSEDSSLVTSVLLAFPMGLIFTAIANSNYLHQRIPEWISTRTSFPSEWYGTFRKSKRYVYLHLKGERRLYGWATEWPDNPRIGHFVIAQPEWILDDNRRVPLLLIEQILIRASDVVMVEIEKPHEEWKIDIGKQKAYEDTMTSLYTTRDREPGDSNAQKQSSAAGKEPAAEGSESEAR